MHFLVLIAIIPGTFQSKIYTGEDLESSLHLLDTHQQNVTPLPRGLDHVFQCCFYEADFGFLLLIDACPTTDPQHIESGGWWPIDVDNVAVAAV